jgi:hypothetical protein
MMRYRLSPNKASLSCETIKGVSNSKKSYWVAFLGRGLKRLVPQVRSFSFSSTKLGSYMGSS